MTEEQAYCFWLAIHAEAEDDGDISETGSHGIFLDFKQEKAYC